MWRLLVSDAEGGGPWLERDNVIGVSLDGAGCVRLVIALTGSTLSGKSIPETTAGSMNGLHLELGQRGSNIQGRGTIA